MRATRAYLASLGTTGLLVLSSVLLLVLGSALVTFDGWPGGSDSDEPESVVVQAAPVADEPNAGPEEVAAIAAPAAEAVAAAAPPSQAPVAGVQVEGDSGGGAPPADGIDVTPPGPGPGAPSDPTDTPPPPPPPPPPTLVDGVADGVESTTTYLGQDVVSQLSPGLGTLLTQAGQGLTDLVRALDGTPAPPR